MNWTFLLSAFPVRNFSNWPRVIDGWVLDDDVQPLFPVPSCVLFARAGRGPGKPLPDKVRRYSGTLLHRDAPEEMADKTLKMTTV